MRIPLFAPIYPSSYPAVREKYSFLRFTTHFFDFGQERYEISCRGENNSGLEVKRRNIIKKGKVTFLWNVIIKPALFGTYIIPIIMFIGLLIYRALNRFQLGSDRLTPERLPNELLHIIARNSGTAALQLAATSKGNRERIQQDPWFQKGCDLLKRSVVIANSLEEEKKKNSLKYIKSFISPYLHLETSFHETHPKHHTAQVTAESNLDAALEIVKSMKKNRPQVLALAAIAKGIVARESSAAKKIEALVHFERVISPFQLSSKRTKVMEKAKKLGGLYMEASKAFAYLLALSDVQSALSIADVFSLNIYKADIERSVIDVLLAKSDPDKALEIASVIKDLPNRKAALVAVFTHISSSDPDRAFILADRFTNLLEFTAALAGIASTNLEKALERAGRIRNVSQKDAALATIVQAIRYSDRERALEIANSLRHAPFEKAAALASIAEACAPSDPGQALEIVNGIENEQIKAETLVQIAFQ